MMTQRNKMDIMKIVTCVFIILLVKFNLFAETINNSIENDDDTKLMTDLKTRRTMLDWHRYTAWATVGMMVMTIATAPEHGTSSVHKTLGILSGVGYLTSGYLAYFAPRFEGTPTQKNISIHQNLAYIHFPSFLLALTSGMIAHNQRKNGKKPYGIGRMHSLFVGATAVSFGLASFMSTDWSVYIVPTSKKEVACIFNTRF